MTATVSAKIPDELKAELEREDVNVSEVIRTALDEELTERRREKLRRDASTLRDRMDEGVETDEIVAAVRETRRKQ